MTFTVETVVDWPVFQSGYLLLCVFNGWNTAGWVIILSEIHAVLRYILQMLVSLDDCSSNTPALVV